MAQLEQLDVSECVRHYAATCGARVAVSRWIPGSGFAETTWAELQEQMLRAAAFLSGLDQRDRLLPLLVGKSAGGIAAMLGAVAIGRPFCFLSTRYRGPQIAAALAASGSDTCVVDSAGLVALAHSWSQYPALLNVRWALIEGPLTGIAAQAAAALRESARLIPFGGAAPADSRAWIPPPCAGRKEGGAHVVGACLFTSGSTGSPKGVLIGREDLHLRALREIEWFGLGEDDVLLSILPFSFDVGLNQLMTGLMIGAEIVLLDSWLPADILRTAAARKVTGISAVPAIWQDMINAGARFDKTGAHAALRYVTVSGGSLPREHLRRLAEEVVPGIGIFKTYGQTEAFRATSLRPGEIDARPDSVGLPFPGVRVYIVRDDGTRCAPGEIGEIVHSGLGTMLGYLGESGEDALTAQKLRPNPFRGPDDPAEKVVFTGDTGYLDDSGYLFLVGRRDSMLKIMGNRVYPQEIANQLMTVEGVKEAVVTGIERNGTGQILAFVVPVSGHELTPGKIRSELSKRLPSFMVPAQIRLVPAIPRTASGKSDVPALLAALAGTESGGEV